MRGADVGDREVLFKGTGKSSWTVEFKGTITRVDVSRIERLLVVEFAILQRQRSLDRTIRRQNKDLEASKPLENNKEPVTEKSNVYRP